MKPIRTINEPLDFYVQKIKRNEPFTSLLYGDGEFQVMSGKRNNQTFTNYREKITPDFAAEMRASLTEPGDDIIRGSDQFLLDWTTYGGNDKAMVREVSEQALAISEVHQVKWYNGVIWDEAVRDGKLGPFLEACNRAAVLVGCNRMKIFPGFDAPTFIEVPGRDASSMLPEIETICAERTRYPCIALFCCGLSAIPLILRLRRLQPEGIYIDLGSVLDIFVGLGGERGWRREMYDNPDKLKACIDSNLSWRHS